MPTKLERLLETALASGKLITQATQGADLLDTNNNELIKGNTTASAVNQLDVTNAATGGNPLLSTSGGDTNISLVMSAKGTGLVVVDDPLVAKFTPATLTTSGNQTLSTAQIIGRLLLRDPNGGAVTDTTPTAAQLVAAMPGVKVGSGFYLTIRNTADAAETITVAGGTGVTISGTATIAQNNSKTFLVYFSNVTSSSEAVTLYSLGTVVH